MFLFLTIWPIVQPSSHTFGSASYTGFLTEERRKEKGALFMKVMFVLIVHKKEVPAGSNPGERIYNHSVKRQHPLLERNWESITRSWKDSEPAFNWCLQYLTVCTWTVQMCQVTVSRVAWCSVLFRDSFILCCFILQAALADDGQWVGFCIEDPVLQWEKVIIREEQVKIPEQTGKSLSKFIVILEYWII